MKIAAFYTLDAVLRHGTFAAAADERNLTPSAVSMQMKQLESHFGQPLFNRAGLHVQPTPLAIEVAAMMRDSLQGLESLRKRPSLTVEGVVRLGIIESMQPTVLPGTMRFLLDRHPRLELKLVRGRSSGLTEAVKAGELDAALVAEPAGGGSARLRWRPIMQRELILVAPPFATESSLSAIFRKYPWIRYDRETVTGELASKFVQTQIGDIRSTMEFDSAPAIIAMVSAGLGVSIIHAANAAALQNHHIRIMRLGRAAPILQFSLVTRKPDDESRSLQALLDAIRSALSIEKKLNF